jgi:hypothetical protein
MFSFSVVAILEADHVLFVKASNRDAGLLVHVENSLRALNNQHEPGAAILQQIARQALLVAHIKRIAGIGAKFAVVTTPHGFKPEASGMTLVCRPTPFVRFMHTSEQSSKQLVTRMARFWNTVVFFTTALRRGTRETRLG